MLRLAVVQIAYATFDLRDTVSDPEIVHDGFELRDEAFDPQNANDRKLAKRGYCYGNNLGEFADRYKETGRRKYKYKTTVTLQCKHSSGSNKLQCYKNSKWRESAKNRCPDAPDSQTPKTPIVNPNSKGYYKGTTELTDINVDKTKDTIIVFHTEDCEGCVQLKGPWEKFIKEVENGETSQSMQLRELDEHSAVTKAFLQTTGSQAAPQMVLVPAGNWEHQVPLINPSSTTLNKIDIMKKIQTAMQSSHGMNVHKREIPSSEEFTTFNLNDQKDTIVVYTSEEDCEGCEEVKKEWDNMMQEFVSEASAPVQVRVIKENETSKRIINEFTSRTGNTLLPQVYYIPHGDWKKGRHMYLANNKNTAVHMYMRGAFNKKCDLWSPRISRDTHIALDQERDIEQSKVCNKGYKINRRYIRTRENITCLWHQIILKPTEIKEGKNRLTILDVDKICVRK